MHRTASLFSVDAIARLLDGLLRDDERGLRCSALGWRFLDEVAGRFFCSRRRRPISATL